jgi:hypothetical protein
MATVRVLLLIVKLPALMVSVRTAAFPALRFIADPFWIVKSSALLIVPGDVPVPSAAVPQLATAVKSVAAAFEK